MTSIKAIKNYLFLFTLIILCLSCEESGNCINKNEGDFSFIVESSNVKVDVSKGNIGSANMSLVSQVGDILLIESLATVQLTESNTSVVGFSFSYSYDIKTKEVVEIQEVSFERDVIRTWNSLDLDLELKVEDLDLNTTNVTGNLFGFAFDPDGTSNYVSFRFEEIPICFE